MKGKTWDPNSVRDMITMRAIQRRRPLNCTMELTYRCNFRCRMCYIRMTDAQAAPFGRMRTVEEWLDMARQMKDAGVLNLILTGGECTLYPGFERLYEAISRMGFCITVKTNAGAYTDSVRDVFLRYPPAGVDVTLYGGSADTYSAVTGDPGGLEKALENIRFFQSIGVPVNPNFTMIRQNVMDYPKVERLCGELGLSCTIIHDLVGHRYDPSWSDALECRLTPAEQVCVSCRPTEEVLLAMEEAGELEKELANFRMPEAADETASPETDDCIGSDIGCAIYWNGEMQTCISMRGYHCVKPFEIGFEAAWAQLKAEQEKTFRRPGACRACGMRNDCMFNCAGRRLEGTGSPHEPAPCACQFTWLLRLYKARRKGTDISYAPECV